MFDNLEDDIDERELEFTQDDLKPGTSSEDVNGSDLNTPSKFNNTNKDNSSMLNPYAN